MEDWVEDVREYGASASVSLFLRFQLEAFVLFFLGSLMHLPHLWRNVEANKVRNACLRGGAMLGRLPHVLPHLWRNVEANKACNTAGHLPIMASS